MQSLVISVRLVALLAFTVAGFSLSANVAHAGYLLGPAQAVIVESAPVEFVEPAECLPCCKRVHKHHYKKHHVRHHKPYKKHYMRHHRSYSYAVPVCTYRYRPQHEIVAFISGTPSGRGGYVNLHDCEPYDPDMSTGDDDPTIYPGMNIDN